MSHPGEIHRLDLALDMPPPLSPATAAVLLTLLDASTTLNAVMPKEVDDWLQFHCGSHGAPAGEADFALSLGSWPCLGTLCGGTDEDPENSTTLICQVSGLGNHGGWQLSGPGIKGDRFLEVVGAPDGFAADWTRQRQTFPRGVDIIFCAGHDIAALPRSVDLDRA